MLKDYKICKKEKLGQIFVSFVKLMLNTRIIKNFESYLQETLRKFCVKFDKMFVTG